MKTGIRIIMGGLGLLGLVLAGLLIYAQFLFDPNVFKPQLQAQVLSKTGRTLDIGGPVSLTVFPRLQVQLAQIRLSEKHAPTQTFASVDQAELALKLWPLLSKQLVIDTLHVEGAQARLVRQADGSLNLADLMQPADPKSTAPTSSRNTMQFDIAGIDIRNSQLDFQDLTQQRSWQIAGLQLRSGRLADHIPTDLSLQAHVRGNQPAIDAQVDFSGQVTLDLQRHETQLRNIRLQLQGDTPWLQQAELVVQGDLLHSATGQALQASSLQLTAKGKRNGLQLDALQLSSARLSFDTARQWLDIAALKLQLQAQQGAQHFEATLDAPQLALSENQASSQAFSGKFNLTGTQHATVQLAAGTLSGSFADFALRNLQVDFEESSGSRSLQGQLRSSVTGSLTEQRFMFPALMLTSRLRDPAMPKKQLQLRQAGTLALDLKNQTVHAQLRGQIDDSQTQTQLDLQDFQALRTRFDLSLDRFNADDYRSPASGDDAADAKAASQQQAQAEARIETAFLRKLDLQGQLRIGALQAQHLQLRTVQAALLAQQGQLDIQRLSAALYQGTLDARARISADQQYRIAATLKNVALEPLLKDAIAKDLLSGTGLVELDVQGQGATVAAIRKSLAGTAQLRVRDGAIKGINLAKSFREWKARISLKQDAMQQASTTEQTDFSEMLASFQIRNGTAHNQDLDIKSPFLRIGGEGDIHIGAGTLDYLLKPTVVNTSTGQDGKALAEIANLTIPVRLTGPWSAIRYQIQYTEVAASLASRLARNKIDQLLGMPTANSNASSATPTDPKQQLKEQAKEGLGNLLKGLLQK